MASKGKKTTKGKSLNFIGFIILFISIIVLLWAVKQPNQQMETEAAGISPLGQTDNWNLIFSDEFDGSTLNQNIWEPSWFAGNNISPPINSDEDGCYDPAQVSLQDGMLQLSAVSTTKTNCKTRSNVVAKYASGLINTRKSFLFSYGYIEARMYLPGANGNIWNWPAFWTDGTGDWPKTGEIDVMESLSGHKPCWHYHYEDSNGNHQGPGGCVNWTDATGWHTYAAKWEPNRITYYYDGIPVGSVTQGIVSAKHFIILNNGINDRYGINVPATVLVDYVRVWQQGNNIPTPFSTAAPLPTAITSVKPLATATPIPTVRPIATPTLRPVVTIQPTSIPAPLPTPISGSRVNVQSFALNPASNITSSTKIKATTTVYSPNSIRVQALTIAVRNSKNNNYDFRGAKTNVTIGPNGYLFSPTIRSFQPGEYTAFVSYKYNNRWYNLAPQISFTVK